MQNTLLFQEDFLADYKENLHVHFSIQKFQSLTFHIL